MTDMLLPVLLGQDLDRNQPIYLPPESFQTHYHLVGGTGAGKTTALHQLLRTIMLEPHAKSCLFIIDPMGNFSRDLLRWMVSSRRFQHVRDRLIYMEPARERYVLPMNPLRFDTQARFYYQIARAVDLILRAWKAQDVGEQPRLMQWSYKTMSAMATLGYPIATSRYLLHGGTDEHKAIVRQLPDELHHEWLEILKSKGSEATRILESTRNRFDPFFKSVILQRMFGQIENRFDTERFIRERRIVIVNLASLGKLPSKLANTIGALIVNEVFEAAYNMAAKHGRRAVEPTYVVLDEFQRFVGPDIEDALPTVRQMGLRLILAHQSFSQLEQGDIDLSNMIWQARSRLCFANSARDADIMAEELAKLTFDKMTVKDVRTTRRQRIAGYRTIWLESEGTTMSDSETVIDQHTVGYNSHTGESRRSGDPRRMENTGTGRSSTDVSGGSRGSTSGTSHGRGQHREPIHEEIEEISNITYESFEEHSLDWMKVIRVLGPGHAFATLVADPNLYRVLVNYEPVRETKRIEDAVDELILRNFEQDMFISAEEADRMAEQDRIRLLNTSPIVLPPADDQAAESGEQKSDAPSANAPIRFRKPRRTS